MEIINKIIETLTLPGVIGGAAFVLEILMRVLKTDKPKSILLVVKAFIQKIPAVMQVIANLLTAVINFIDGMLPAQKLNAPKE